MSDDFDPTSDWPPEGASVQMVGVTVATFREDPMPGWWLTDGRYCRPFDSTGLLLAQRWATNAEMAAARDADRVAHRPDWSDWAGGADRDTCSCGYNGTARECAESRAANEAPTSDRVARVRAEREAS